MKDDLNGRQPQRKTNSMEDDIKEAFQEADDNEYPPLIINSLPERVKQNLNIQTKPPVISEFDCYKKIKDAKKPDSGIHGD